MFIYSILFIVEDSDTAILKDSSDSILTTHVTSDKSRLPAQNKTKKSKLPAQATSDKSKQKNISLTIKPKKLPRFSKTDFWVHEAGLREVYWDDITTASDQVKKLRKKMGRHRKQKISSDDICDSEHQKNVETESGEEPIIIVDSVEQTGVGGETVIQFGEASRYEKLSSETAGIELTTPEGSAELPCRVQQLTTLEEPGTLIESVQHTLEAGAECSVDDPNTIVIVVKFTDRVDELDQPFEIVNGPQQESDILIQSVEQSDNVIGPAEQQSDILVQSAEPSDNVIGPTEQSDILVQSAEPSENVIGPTEQSDILVQSAEQSDNVIGPTEQSDIGNRMTGKSNMEGEDQPTITLDTDESDDKSMSPQRNNWMSLFGCSGSEDYSGCEFQCINELHEVGLGYDRLIYAEIWS